MIEEIGNKYTPEDLKDKINELIKVQNQAKNDKNENKQSKLDEWNDMIDYASWSDKMEKLDIVELAQSAIDEIIQQKDEEIEESNGAFESLLTERNALLDIEINLNNKIRQLEKEIYIDEKLLEENDRLLNIIPECKMHGKRCIPHAIEYIKKLKQQKPKIDDAIIKILKEMLRNKNVASWYDNGILEFKEKYKYSYFVDLWQTIRSILQQLGVTE